MYTGELMDANDLVYLRARYYHPGLGVFMSLDPVEGVNRYQYVGGNVTNMVDPSGLQGGQNQSEECVQKCLDNNRFATNFASIEYCLQISECFCPWQDYDELQELMPSIEAAVQRWNRISLLDRANQQLALNDSCSVNRSLSCDTGFSNDAFAAILAARLHEEGRLDFHIPGLAQDLSDYAYKLGLKHSTLGIANLDPSQDNVVGELLDMGGGRFPPHLAPQLGRFDNNLLHNVNGNDYIGYYNTNQNDRGAMYDFLRQNEVAIELEAANMYRGILAAKSDETFISGPTVFNMATWTLAGQIENYQGYGNVNPVSNGLHLMNHVKMILEGPCNLGLSATPGIDFEYYNDHDQEYFDANQFQQ